METTIYTVNGQNFELRHYGVKGMKWGVRRKRNVLGAPSGVKGGPYGENRTPRGAKSGPYGENKTPATARSAQSEVASREARKQKLKRAAKIGAAVAATALAAYGAKKVHDVIRDKNKQIYLRQARARIEAQRVAMRENMGYRPGYHNAELHDKFVKKVRSAWRSDINAARRDAEKDTFKEAARNVYRDYRSRRGR